MPKKAKSVTTQAPFLGQVHQQNKPISKKELVAWLGCSSKYVEAEVKAGKLRIHRMSRRMVRFSPSDIEAWMASKAV